jgi:hypothetical protein
MEFRTSICPWQYGQSLVAVSPFQSPPSDWTIDDEGTESFIDNRLGATTSIVDEDPDLFALMSSPHLIIQQELNDLVRDLNLSQTELRVVGFTTARFESARERC